MRRRRPSNLPQLPPGGLAPRGLVGGLVKQRYFLAVIWGLLLLFPGGLWAAEVPVRLNLYAEGGVLTKKVKSLKEVRLKQMVPQSRDFSCGAASLATLLHYYYGQPVSEMDAILGMFRYGVQEDIRKRGFSLLDMKRYVETLNYQAEGYKVPRLSLLQDLTLPVIALIETNRYKHFVVIRRTDDRYVYLADPSWGNRRMTLEDFDRVWSDKIIFAVQGPVVGSPEGLYVEGGTPSREVALALQRDLPLALTSRLSMDPSRSLVFVGRTAILNLQMIFIGTRK